MEVNNIQNVNDVSFGIKVAKNFISAAHNNYHYNNVPNKMRHIYAFNQKTDEFSKFGYDNYTIDYSKKLEHGNWQHYLIAIKDGSNGQDKLKIAKKATLQKLINRFMEIRAKDINNIFKNKS